MAAGLVSSPPARICVVVGGDTNNGFAAGTWPPVWCPQHQRGYAWLLVGTPTTASPLAHGRWPGVLTTSEDTRGC